MWLGNARGNVYSCNHTSLNPYGSSKERKHFWSFSWHEIGYYDLPKSIDYVLNQTGVRKLQFIGHSQGSTAFLVMTSDKPEYNDKIELMHGLGPVAFLSHVISPAIRVIAPFVFWVEVKIVQTINFHLLKYLKVYFSLPCREWLHCLVLTTLLRAMLFWF